MFFGVNRKNIHSDV